MYSDCARTVEELLQLGAQVQHGVDAANLSTTLNKTALNQRWDRVVWNFPCLAVGKGNDGQNAEMDANRELVRGFCRSVAPLLADGGEVHLSHKTKPPFNQWSLVELCIEAGLAHYSLTISLLMFRSGLGC